ncbi:nuclear transport factor 2 family protein [Phenylobacterium sp. 20VBR1]|uniref:Nuclear transport factor 2 family protein n=2 Tax=Phenylobacterium glaciei TaxID=2803784 RepID=A0A941HVG1_9CAUL|nr:nuclear transport factor 2 family protein [Phenylobacterium glaciei]MBR7618678.1 nuclear transport factor 2 family protein [Phenylobacterium glaciei]
MPLTISPWNRTKCTSAIGLCGLFAAVVMIAAGTAAVAHPAGQAKPAALSQPTFDPSAAEVVDAFHAALERGDTTAAAGYLSDALVVFEEGEAERSKAEYAGHHLPADAVFAKAVGSHMTGRSGGVSGDVAWVASEGRTQGRYQERDIDQITTETMVLRRVSGAWKIVHVHWSSRAAKPKP